MNVNPDESEVGDPACWLARVCPECGALVDSDPPAICPRCHTELLAE